MNSKTVVIAGIGGFIGRHLVSLFRATSPGAFIVGLGRGENSDANEMFSVDLLNKRLVQDIVGQIQPDYIFHLAGIVYSKEWGELYCGNVQTTINILQAVQELGVAAKIIIPGSAAEYGAVPAADLPLFETQALNPVTPYGVSKVWQTAAARYYATKGLNVVVGRIFNVIGRGIPETLSIGAFVSQLGRIRKGEIAPIITVGNLKSKRDFVDIRDVCYALIALAMHGVSGEVYNVCSGDSISMEYILGELIGRIGLDVQVTIDPSRIKNADVEEIYGSNQKIRKLTGWERAFSLSDSITSIIG